MSEFNDAGSQADPTKYRLYSDIELARLVINAAEASPLELALAVRLELATAKAATYEEQEKTDTEALQNENDTLQDKVDSLQREIKRLTKSSTGASDLNDARS